MGIKKVQELVELLKDLQTAKFSSDFEFLKTLRLVEKILKGIFEIEVTKTELTESEKNVIGPLIADSLSTIGAWVSCSVDDIRKCHMDALKVPRSGVQFILDRYQDFPDGEENSLADALEYFKETEDIEGWDQKFKIVNDSYDPYFCYEKSGEPILSEQEMAAVPATHWWWRC